MQYYTTWCQCPAFALMLLPVTWVILLLLGFSMMFWGASEPSFGTSLSLSGAAITTEGFLAPKGVGQTTLYILEGIIGSDSRNTC